MQLYQNQISNKAKPWTQLKRSFYSTQGASRVFFHSSSALIGVDTHHKHYGQEAVLDTEPQSPKERNDKIISFSV
jgi:hypothetical protein